MESQILQKREILIFTDGACKRNGKPNAIASIGVHFPNNEYNDVSELLIEGKQTNQRAELYAIIKAFQITQQSSDNLIIVTDSLYCCNIIDKWLSQWISKNIQKENWDLIMILYELMKCRQYKMVHIRGHQNIKKLQLSDEQKMMAVGNNMADRLATSAIKDL